MNEKSFALIFGYITNIDSKQITPISTTTPERLTFALDSNRSSSEDMYFDSDLFIHLLKISLQGIKIDSIALVDSDGNVSNHESIENLCNTIIHFDKDGLTPLKILVSLDETLICVGEMRYFTSVGGPYPYHDTYAFSLFSNSFDRESIQNDILKYCISKSVFLRDIVTANIKPKTTLLYFLKRIFA